MKHDRDQNSTVLFIRSNKRTNDCFKEVACMSHIKENTNRTNLFNILMPH